MKKILLRFLEDEQVSSVYRVTESSYKELSCVEVFYTKQGRHYVARSFCTDMWIAGQPTGPYVNETGFLQFESIEDVATIFEYSDTVKWKKHNSCSEAHLKTLYEMLEIKAKEYANSLLGEHSEKVYHVRFTFTPMPLVIVSLVYKRVFMGSLSIDMSGRAEVLTATVPAVNGIVAEINLRPKSIYKEIGNV